MRYAVVRNEVNKKFTYFHNTFEKAKDEAERLCNQEKVPFIILELVGQVDIKSPEPPLEWHWERPIE